VDEEREEEVEEEGLEGVEERGDVAGEGGYLKEESHYQMMAEGDKVPPDQENSKGKKNPHRFSYLQSNFIILFFLFLFFTVSLTLHATAVLNCVGRPSFPPRQRRQRVGRT
jgi:hypothetical protein